MKRDLDFFIIFFRYPKAWEGMSIEEKTSALYDFTKDSMTQLLDNGVDVCMVQVGNETNNGMAGPFMPFSVARFPSATAVARSLFPPPYPLPFSS